MQEDLIIAFEYNGRWNSDSSRRRVVPYQILMDEGLCLLFGYDLNKSAVRLFALNRMKNCVVTDERFDLPDDFEFSPYCSGGKFGAFVSEDSVDFIIDFYGDARAYVKERLWADNQKLTDFEDEEKTRIEFSSSQVLKVMEWILAQGANTVPQSPQWFVDDWKKTVKAMVKRAKSV